MRSVQSAFAGLTLLVVALVASGCGGASGLKSDDAGAIVKAWANVACAKFPVKSYGPGDIEADDVERGATCDRGDVQGTLMQKRQMIFVFNSESARDTFMVGKDCRTYFRVLGANWVAITAVQKIATDLVDNGGELCNQ